MTESMIERVAEAIKNCKEDGYNAVARAAIEAMREPTKTMLKAGMREQGTTLQAEYIAMIDAALIWPAGSADRAGVPLARD